jgi:hypothetical protein
VTSKSFVGVEVKDADSGLVEAVFSTFNVKDRDGDVTRPGAFTDGTPVRISAYGHASWGREGVPMLPVGKGAIRQTATEAIFSGQFFMDTIAGRETFLTVKAMGELQEWSYSVHPEKASFGDFNGQRVQFLDKLKGPHEVSPVLAGAGLNTRTLAVKSAKQLNSALHSELCDAGRERFGATDGGVYVDDFDVDEGWVVYAVYSDSGPTTLMRVSFTRTDNTVTLGADAAEVEELTQYAPKSARLDQHITAVLASLSPLVDRAADVKAKRHEKGKELGVVSHELLGRLHAEVKRLGDLLVTAHSPADAAAIEREYLRHVVAAHDLRLG